MKIYVIEDNNDLTLDDFMIGLENIPDNDIDHWQTDLYLRKTPETTKLIQTKLPKSFKVTTFIDNIDKVPWYEIPFAFSKGRKRIGKVVKESIDKTLPFNYRGMGVIDINVTDKWPTGKHIWNIGKHNPYIDKGYVIVCNTRDYNVIPETLEFVYVGSENAEALHKEAGKHTVNDKNYKKYLVTDIDLDETILNEDESDIETWDISFWDAEEQESYDTKTVRMTKNEVEDYVDKLNAKRSEYDKENGSFYDYVLA